MVYSLALGLLGLLPTTLQDAEGDTSPSFDPSIERVTLELFDPTTRSRTTLTHRNGLPTNAITALCYDPDGFLLVGTRGGLARYDGTTFEALLAKDHPGLGGDRILTLHTDDKERTWVGANMAAPGVYSDGEFHALCHRSVVHSVRQILPASDGSFWLAGNVLARVVDQKVSVVAFDQDRPRAQPNAVHEDPSGRLWVATGVGVYVGTASGFERVDKRAADAMIADFGGEPWCQDPDGVLFQPLEDPEPPIQLGKSALFGGQFELDATRRLQATNRGVLLLEPGHPDGTGLRVRAVNGTLRSPTRIETITQFLRDGEDDVWLGNSYSGLDHLEHFYSRLVNLPDRKTERPISGAHPIGDGEALVFGSLPRQVFLIDSDGQATSLELTGGAANVVFGAASNASGTWAATQEGITKLDANRLVPVPEWPTRCENIITHPDGSIWASFGGVVRCVATASGETVLPSESETYQFPTEWIQGLCRYQDSIAANDNVKVMKMDRELGRWTRVATLERAKVRDIREGESGELWVTTYGQGLLRVALDGHVDRWSHSAGLPDRFLSWVGPIDENGHLWLNANSGVVRIDVASLDAYLDGSLSAVQAVTFPSPEANGPTGAELRGDVFLLPTLRGAALFDRARVPQVMEPPRVVFRPPLVDGIPLHESEGAIGKANVIFKFTAPIFPAAGSATFQYRLRDQDQEWLNAGTARSVLFPALGPGTYALEVRAKTPKSLWSLPTTSEPLVVRRHWYQQAWTWALGALGFILTIFWLVALRTSYLRRQNDALSQEVRQRLEVEDRLRSSEERYRQLFHTAPSAIMSWSPAGRLLDRNERANELFGWSQEDAVDVDPWDLFADSQLGRDAFVRVLKDHEDLTFTAEAKPVNGPNRRCQWQFAHSFDASGELSTIIALVADLSKQDEDARSLNRLRASLADAEETERSRIARELHDDLSQRLAALAMEAHVVDESLVDSTPLRNRTIPSFRSALENITSDVHSLSRKLHPTIVDDLGLIAALRSESARRGELRGMAVQMNIHGEVCDPPRDVALALFRIAQEALSNATRHSGASGIQLHLSEEEGALELVIEDNGRGIESNLIRAGGGVGLNSMRERARLKGGDLTLETRPGGGTRVVASIPSTVTS